MMVSSRNSKRILCGVMALVCVLLILELGSFAAIALTASIRDEDTRRTTDIFREQSLKIQQLLDSSPKLVQLDPVLGWRYRPGHRDPENQINSQGVRSGREYSTVPEPGVIRVAAFGDSFVYSNEVANDDTWSARMEALSPRMEVLNYGVGGYGTDQAFLRYLNEGSRLSTDVVIIGFAPDDLRRVVNVYRRFISNREFPLVKPRFVLTSDGDLVLLQSPLQRVSDYDTYLRQPAKVIKLGRNDQW